MNKIFFSTLIWLLSACAIQIDSNTVGAGEVFENSVCNAMWGKNAEWIIGKLDKTASDKKYWLISSGGDLSVQYGYSSIESRGGNFYFEGGNTYENKIHEEEISETTFAELKKEFVISLNVPERSRHKMNAIGDYCSMIISTINGEVKSYRAFHSDQYGAGVLFVKPVDNIYFKLTELLDNSEQE